MNTVDAATEIRSIRIAIRWLLLLVCLYPTLAMAGDVEVKAHIDRDIRAFMEVSHVAGLSLAIVREGRVFHLKGFGFADRAREIRATPDTLYGIGSVTKPFTATVAMVLRDAAMIALDEPVSMYLPDDVTVPMDAAGRRVTLQDLLTHTSGLPRDPLNRKNQVIEGPYDPGLLAPYEVTDLQAALRTTVLEAPVGARWSYSNYGYQLAGYVLERATGVPYETLLKSRLLDSLAMNDTTVTLDAARSSQLAAAYWTVDRHRKERPRAKFGQVAAMGGIISSVRDLAKFALLQLKQVDRPGDPISLGSLHEMRRSTADIANSGSFCGEPLSQGYGWRIRNAGSATVSYQHGGSLDGHTAAFWFSPSEQLAIVILSNAGEESMVVENIQEWLIGLLRSLQ